MALSDNHFDSVVALILIFVVGFGAAALFPEHEWIRALTWVVALGVALASTIRRWMKTDEEELTPDQSGSADGDGTAAPSRDDPVGPPPGV